MADVLPTARFRPRIRLQTLGRGDGLLGMRPSGNFGPRGGNVTVVAIDWLYVLDTGSGRDVSIRRWVLPAPSGLLNRRPDSARFLQDAQAMDIALRDRDAEADALDRVWDCGLLPLPPDHLQWRALPDTGSNDDDAADTGFSSRATVDHLAAPPLQHGPLWTLLQEDAFDDFWADILPQLQQEGWSVTVAPGFAHQSVPVDAWRLEISPATGELLSREIFLPLRARPGTATMILPLDRNAAEASWMVSLGVEIDGERVDLVPMLANLLKRDARWLDATRLAAIDDEESIRLRAPGGRRIDAPAAPLKAIVANLLDLLSDDHVERNDRDAHGGPLPLSGWDACRIAALEEDLRLSAAGRAGIHGAWQLQGAAGLRTLAQRLGAIGTPPPVAPPVGLAITLRPYQLQGLAWLQYLRAQHLGGILADDMGLGKTAQALAHVLLEKEAGRLDLPALAVMPSSLLFNWQAEAARMTPGLRVLCLQGPERARDFERLADHDLVLTTYPLLLRDGPMLARQEFHLLILDEAQTVKNPTARSAAAVRRLDSRHRLCLTGTPLENHLGELWAQFDFLMPGFLGDARSFRRRWRRPIEIHGETQRAQLLARRVRPFILRRRKNQVATELPPRVRIDQRVRLVGAQRDLYESVRVASDDTIRRVLQRKGFTGGRIDILDALLKLRQVCCDPSLVKNVALAPDTERAKLDHLRTLLPALVEQGRRLLVFSQFTAMLDLIGIELTQLGLPWLSLTGATPVSQRANVVARFQQGEAPILLISLKAGGLGLNLTAADTVIHVDPWWNPAVEEQATARAHRIGQNATVFVYRLLVEGSIEERILALQARKAALAEQVLGSDSDAEGPSFDKFDAEDLAGLLAPLS